MFTDSQILVALIILMGPLAGALLSMTGVVK